MFGKKLSLQQLYSEKLSNCSLFTTALLAITSPFRHLWFRMKSVSLFNLSMYRKYYIPLIISTALLWVCYRLFWDGLIRTKYNSQKELNVNSHRGIIIWDILKLPRVGKSASQELSKLFMFPTQLQDNGATWPPILLTKMEAWWTKCTNQ